LGGGRKARAQLSGPAEGLNLCGRWIAGPDCSSTTKGFGDLIMLGKGVVGIVGFSTTDSGPLLDNIEVRA